MSTQRIYEGFAIRSEPTTTAGPTFSSYTFASPKVVGISGYFRICKAIPVPVTENDWDVTDDEVKQFEGEVICFEAARKTRRLP
jgi:hypothetical protein